MYFKTAANNRTKIENCFQQSEPDWHTSGSDSKSGSDYWANTKDFLNFTRC